MLGFHYATQSGTTVSISDIVVPDEKYKILDDAQHEVDKLHEYVEQGFMSHDEQYNKTINVWSQASEEVTTAMQAAQNPLNPVFMMATSGARGSIAQVKQLGGMRGLMSDPSGRILEIPVKASLKEGLTVLEYFISTHGARKGLADTALRTADSGYLTRRLVDVAQDVIVREDDCHTPLGITVSDIAVGKETIEPLYDRIVGRRAAADIKDPERPRHKIIQRDEEITEEKALAIVAAGIHDVKIRSVLTCQAKYGVCAACYGRNLATGKRVDIGEAVGIIAAPVDRRAGHAAHAADLPHRRRRDRGHHHRSAACRGNLRSAQAQGPGHDHRGRRHGAHRRGEEQADRHRHRLQGRRAHLRRAVRHASGGVRGRERQPRRPTQRRLGQPARHPADQGRDGAAELPGAGSAEGLPLAGRRHQRQAHRGHRPFDAP